MTDVLRTLAKGIADGYSPSLSECKALAKAFLLYDAERSGLQERIKFTSDYESLRLRLAESAGDLKLIDELLCDLRQADGLTWKEMETFSSINHKAMARLRHAWTTNQMPLITLSLADYFRTKEGQHE
jgi:hypothetical protein